MVQFSKADGKVLALVRQLRDLLNRGSDAVSDADLAMFVIQNNLVPRCGNSNLAAVLPGGAGVPYEVVNRRRKK